MIQLLEYVASVQLIPGANANLQNFSTIFTM